jgi:two-component system, chemotaxis family, CheB/CheR fusion protein
MGSRIRQPAQEQRRSLPIVAVGASAGGLAAFERFLSTLPRKFGFCLVFLQHLSPDHQNLLLDLVRSRSKQRIVEEVSDGLTLEPDKVYLCPPAGEVRIEKGVFRVIPRVHKHVHLPIDELFLSLSEGNPEAAVAVILSGAGTDGARGVQALKSRGGTVFVQDPVSAEYPDMPVAAINATVVDAVLPPEGIAKEILKFSRSGTVGIPDEQLMTAVQFDSLYQIMNERTGTHFSHYKASVVTRRVRRRMYLQGIRSIDDYLTVLTEKEQEADDLASDILIGVTSFFRDRLAWKALHLEVTRKLIVKGEGSPIRVWAAACASGEEAYSIAMMLQHELDAAGSKQEFQVFATDVNERAMQRAREATYPESISVDLPPEYLQAYFSSSEDGLFVTVNKEIRQHVIFARHNLLTDPPFSRLDLVICRNLLIYLDTDAQEKCISLFHYALKKGGFLFLGNAESPGRTTGLFINLAHKKCRIYRKAEVKQNARLRISMPITSDRVYTRSKVEAVQSKSMTEIVQEVLLEEYAPAAVAVNQQYEIVYHNGATNRFLHQPRGIPTHNLLDLLPEKLKARLRGALYRVSQDGKPLAIRTTVTHDERKRPLLIRVSKVRDSLFLLTFRERGNTAQDTEAPVEGTAIEEKAILQLERELAGTREDLQSHIEEARSANEELESSNEELQAANEELETSREELQSLNEELTTVNNQLQTKIDEQEEINNDLSNFLASTNIPTIFLDHRFRVRRFTPAISRLITLIPADIGRSITDMSGESLGAGLMDDAQSVLDRLTTVRRELIVDGLSYVRSILPYRTGDNRIEGVVVTYVDITERVKVEESLRQSESKYKDLVQNAASAIIRWKISGEITFFNEFARSFFGYSADEIIGKHVGMLLPQQETTGGGLTGLVADIVNHSEKYINNINENICRDGRRVWMAWTNRPIFDEDGQLTEILAVGSDITQLKEAEARISHLASFPELNPNPVMEVDMSGRVIFSNPATKTALTRAGLREGDARLLLPADMDELLGQWDKGSDIVIGREVEAGTCVFDETIQLLPDLSAARIYARDITTRKKAEEAARKSQKQNEFLANVIELAAQPFGVVYPGGHLGMVNKAFEELTGYGPDELRSRDWSTILTPPEWVEPEKAWLDELNRTGHPVRYEKEYIRKDGSRVPIESLVHLGVDQDGKPLYYSFLTDITERKRAEQALRESEQRVRVKLEAILAPEGDIGDLELADIIDVPAVQSLMDEFYAIAHFPMAIVDMKGRVLIGVGWQNICTKFHRVHPETCAHCVESDLVLSAGVPSGDSRLYKCKNNMWDIATPVMIGDRHMGNLFSGQFFFEDETIDYGLFRSQARTYGFDEDAYMASLDAAPRFPKATVARGMAFLTKLSHMVSQLSYSNIKLARSMAQAEILSQSLRESEERYRSLFRNLLDAYCYCEMILDENGRAVDYIYLEANEAFTVMSGYADVVGRRVTEVIPGVLEAHPEMFETYGRVAMTGCSEKFEIHFAPSGRWFTVQAYSVRKGYVAIVFENITERKLQESRISGLSRLYAVLSRVNETIVRARDEQSLFDEVCSIVSSVGGFPLVWIGFVKEGQVVPVASCGTATSYLSHIRVDVEGPFSQGPTGTCIREGRPVINADFQTNVRTTPWREQAQIHNLQASASFPIRRGGEAIGAFTIYASESNAFDDEQVNLLDSLAADVSYALDAFAQETLRVQADDALRRSEERFHSMFSRHRAIMLLIDPVTGVIVDANDAASRFYGYLPEDLCKMNIGDINQLPPEEVDLQRQKAARDAQDHFVFPHRRADGVIRWVEVYSTPFEAGGRTLLFSVIHDITERRRAEEALRHTHEELEQRVRQRTAELQKAYDELVREGRERRQLEEQLRQAQKMEALGTLTGGIAHDFNNILGAIIGFTEIVKGRLNDGAREKHHLDRVLDAGLRGRELIKRMMAFSRKTEQEKKPILLSVVLQETMAFIRSSTPATVTIRVTVESESGLIFADPVQIQQVILNLCTNAVQAMQDKGGTLSVELTKWIVDESKRESARLASGLYMKLTIRDTGTGIPSAIIDRVFDPFFTTKRVGEGTGLGLSVVHGIVHQHEGYITVESEEGKGSAFTVYLPTVAVGRTQDAVDGESSVPMGTERILFIDDEELLAEVGQEILEDLGYHVTACTSSTEALGLFRADPGQFDLIITDVTMPEITGVDLAREMVKIRSDIPIIMCTGFSHLTDASAARAAGIRAFVMKPLTKKEIARTIRSALGN